MKENILFWLCFIYASCWNHGQIRQSVSAITIFRRAENDSNLHSETFSKNNSNTDTTIDPAMTLNEHNANNNDTFANVIEVAEPSGIKKDYLSELPPDIQSKIADNIFNDNSIDVLDLKKTNKYWRTHLHNHGYSQYSVIGSKRRLANDARLCSELENKPNQSFYKHVRKMMITKRLWDKCEFLRNREFVNLEELTINVHCKIDQFGYLEALDTVNDDDDDGAEEMVKIWNDIREKGYFPKLKSLNIKNSMDEGMLHIMLLSRATVDENRLKKVEEFLKSKLIFVNDTAYDGSTPLHYCLAPDVFRARRDSNFDTMDCIKLLLKYGADPNFFNHNDYSPIHYASALFEKGPLEFLLKHGGDMDLHVPIQEDKNSIGTPIFVALQTLTKQESTEFEHWKSYLYMISYSNRFRSLIQESGMLEWFQVAQEIDVQIQHPFYYLLNKGADLSIRADYSGSVLAEAISSRSYDVVYDILDSEQFSPDLLNIPNDEGESVLMISWPQHPDIFNILLGQGVDLNYKNANGENILLHIFNIGFPSVDLLKKLLKAGIDINSMDSDGNSIFTIGLKNKIWDIRSATEGSSTFFHIMNLAVNNGLNLHHQNKNGDSNMILMLYFALFRLQSTQNDRLAKILLNSILDNIHFDRVLKNKIDLAPGEIETYILDAHVLFLAVYETGNKRLMSKLKSKLPKEIMDHFQHPFFNKFGLIYSQKFIDNYQYILASLDHTSRHFWAVHLLSIYSPYTFHFIKNLKLRYEELREYNLQKVRKLESVIIEGFSTPIEDADFHFLSEFAANYTKLKEFKVYVFDSHNLIDYALSADIHNGEKRLLDKISDKLFEFMKDEVNIHTGRSTLHICIDSIEHSNWCVPELIRRGVDPNINDGFSLNPLQEAIAQGNFFGAKELLKATGIDLNVRVPANVDVYLFMSYNIGATLLHLAALHGDRHIRAQYSRLLLKRDIPVNVIDMYGKTPLRYAVLNEDIEIIKSILEKDPEALFTVGFDGQTPLMDAVKRNNFQIFSLLLGHSRKYLGQIDHDQFLNKKNVFDMTVRDYALCLKPRDLQIMHLLGISDPEYNETSYDPVALKMLKMENFGQLDHGVSIPRETSLLKLWNYLCLTDFYKYDFQSVKEFVQIIFPVNDSFQLMNETVHLVVQNAMKLNN